MPEEQVGELYAKLSMDMEEFSTGLDETFKRLDELEKRQVEVGVETDSMESGFDAMSAAAGFFGGVISTTLMKVKQTSGGLAAMLDFLWGMLSVPIDQVLSADWGGALEDLGETIFGTSEEVKKGTIDFEKYAANITATIGPTGELELSTQRLDSGTRDLMVALEGGNKMVDEFGNVLIHAGDAVYAFDDATGKFLGSMPAWDETFRLMQASMETYSYTIRDSARDMGVAAGDLVDVLYSNQQSLDAIFSDTSKPKEYMDTITMAAKWARWELDKLLLSMGLKPSSVSEAAWAKAKEKGKAPILRKPTLGDYDMGGSTEG